MSNDKKTYFIEGGLLEPPPLETKKEKVIGSIIAGVLLIGTLIVTFLPVIL